MAVSMAELPLARRRSGRHVADDLVRRFGRVQVRVQVKRRMRSDTPPHNRGNPHKQIITGVCSGDFDFLESDAKGRPMCLPCGRLHAEAVVDYAGQELTAHLHHG